MRQPERTTLLEQAHRRILDGVFLPACESQNVPKMSVKEPKVKNACGLKMPTQNRSASGKTVMEKSGKSKATESSQG